MICDIATTGGFIVKGKLPPVGLPIYLSSGQIKNLNLQLEIAIIIMS